MTNRGIGDELVGAYMSRLAEDVVITPSENGSLVITPFTRPDGKPIGMDVLTLQDGRVRISDKGGSFGYLYLNGLPFSRPALDSIERIAERYGVSLYGDALVAVTDAASVGDALHRVIQAAISVTALVAALDTGWLGSSNAAKPIAPTGEDQQPVPHPSSPFCDDSLTALQRAAKKARRQAIEFDGYIATWRDGKIEYDTEP